MRLLAPNRIDKYVIGFWQAFLFIPAILQEQAGLIIGYCLYNLKPDNSIPFLRKEMNEQNY